MANGNSSNGPTQVRWIVAAAAGVVAFLLARFASEVDFGWALLIGIVVFVIVLYLWAQFGGQPAARYTSDTRGAAPPAAAAPATPAAEPLKTAASDLIAAAEPEAMGETKAHAASLKVQEDAMLSRVSEPVAPPAAVMSAPSAKAKPAAVKAAKPVAVKAETAAKPAVAKAEKAAKPAVVKAEKAAKPLAVKAEKAAKPAVVKAEKAAKPAVVKAEKAAKPVVVKAEKAAKPKPAKAAGPELLKAPRGGKADDLKMIEGVGPAMERLINGLGVWHFDQIAKWTAKDIEAVDVHMKTFRGRIIRDKWVAQAKIIVKDGIDAFLERAKTNDY